MKHNIFTSTKHWKFTTADEAAEEKFKELEATTRETLPENFYQRPLIKLDLIRASPLYALMKTIPKGVMHHNHYFCNDDWEFYQQHIIPDPRIYLTADLTAFEIGTTAEAEKNGWVSMQAGQERFGQAEWLRRVVQLTAFTPDEMQTMNYKSKQTWTIFESKIRAPLKIMFVRDIYEKYSKHVLEKYIKNGYDRIEIRCTYEKLYEYDQQGNFVKRHQYETFISSLDGVIVELTKRYPDFSFGFIFVGFKMFTDEFNEELFRMACSTNWDKLVGFDFVQEEDKYDSLAHYDPIVDRILQEFPHLDRLKKAYHAGETTNHLTNNIDVAVKAGSVRIGHGLNILQRIEFLPHCKNVCFEKNPISNLLLGYKSDLREASAPILLGLGYPVSISPDDPGKFGYEDSTADYFAAALSYNWSLRHLKLVAYHSINYAICEQGVRSHLVASFERKWDEWVHGFLELQRIEGVPKGNFHYEDIFTFSKSWSFNEQEEEKNRQFVEFIDRIILSTPEDIYQNNFIQSKKYIQSSPLFTLLKSMPKGTLQTCHFIANHDVEFIRRCIIPDHDIYLNDYSKELMIATPQESEAHSWTSLDQLKLKYQSEEDLALYVYSLTSFTNDQLGDAAGHQAQFHRIDRKKKQNLQTLLTSEAIFRKYAQYTLQKMAGLGYLRVEFRLEPIKLIQFSENGDEVQKHDYVRMTEIIDEEYSKIVQQYPNFSIGFIILGNKQLARQDNLSILDAIAKLNWKKVVGFDFEQDIEDNYTSLCNYAEIIDQILQRNQDLSFVKAYQAGNSSNHFNNNIQSALQNGSRRICNGLNILQQVDLLAKCRDVCFEVNPILNLAEGASKRTDFRLSIAPILLGLGFPVTINSDLSGVLGFEDTTYDLFLAAISYNWSLKHIKLMLLHSITHSISTEGRRRAMLRVFGEVWQKWISTVTFQ